MAVLRKEKREQFTVIDNAIFKDYELSYKAKGLLCQMLSLPDNWEFSIDGLATLSSDGISAVRSALDELKKAGYFRREQRMKDGKFDGVEYIISETKKYDFPIAENLISENLISENHTQLNTNNNKLPIQSNTKDIYTEFENLWELYPKKQGKDKAKGYYERARKNGTTYEEVEQGIYAYKEYISANGIDMQYVKQGSTFFSQKAWSDDWSIRNQSKGSNPFMEMLQTGDY